MSTIDDHAPGSTPSTLDSTPLLPLVGREEEFANVDNLLRSLSEGKGKGLAIRAESGFGKSRLAQELARHARNLGIRVAVAPCRGSIYRPFQPLVELVRELFKIDDAIPVAEQRLRIARTLNELSLDDLNKTFLELLRIGPGDEIVGTGSLGPSTLDDEMLIQTAIRPAATPARPPEQDDLTGEHTLFDLSEDIQLSTALNRVLKAFGQKDQAVFLVFDDLDQANARARLVAQHLLVEAGEMPVLILATYTTGKSELLDTVFDGAIHDLSRLSHKETLEFITSAFENPAADLPERVWAATEGHPLYTSLMVQYLRESGYEGRELPSMNGVIVKRAGILVEKQRKYLVSAAILGDGFRAGALRVLSEQTGTGALFDTLQSLEQAGWLIRTGTGRRAIHFFANQQTREILYGTIPDNLKINMHGLAGDYYATPTAGRRVRVEQAIYHYLRAEKIDRALAAIDMALLLARRESDNKQIEALCRRAIELAAKDPRLNNKQAEYAEMLGDYYATDADYVRAMEAYSDLSPTVSPISLLVKLGLVLLAVEPNHAINVLTQVVPVIPQDSPKDAHWRVQAGLVWALALSGRTYEAIRYCRDALGLLSSTAGLGAPRTLLRAVLGMVLFYQGDHTEAYPHLESARAGWGARGYEEGMLLVNQVLIDTPKSDVTRTWLRMLLRPLLEPKR